MRGITEAMSFRSDGLKRDNIKHVLRLVKETPDERGYNSVNQLAGYLISNDPVYISSYDNACTITQSVGRYEIIEELVRVYLEEDK